MERADAMMRTALSRSLEQIKAIAEDVARETDDRPQIVGVLPGAGRGGYAEIVVVCQACGSGPRVLVIGVDRGVTEAILRQQLSTQLRAMTLHAS
jgi:hypothetical protein